MRTSSPTIIWDILRNTSLSSFLVWPTGYEQTKRTEKINSSAFNKLMINDEVKGESPFASLPPELIREIFYHCLPKKPNFSAKSAPLLLTHVCHSWRTLALSMPTLWSRIHVPGWEESSKNVHKLFQLFIERTGTTSLDLDICLFAQDVQVYPGKEESEHLDRMLEDMVESFSPHVSRINRFRGVFPEYLMEKVGVDKMINAEQIFFCGMLKDTMMLEGVDNQDMDLVQKKLDLGSQRDALQRLAICGCGTNFEPIMHQTQLVHLELIDLHRGGDLCQEVAYELMKHLPNLKTCVFDITKKERAGWVIPNDRITLPNLELLFISWIFPAEIHKLLDSISTPNLDKLGLRGTPASSGQQWDGLFRFLEGSQAHLKRISIGDFASVDARLIDCFKQMPELEHLTINHTVISDEMFQLLSGASDICLLPKLQVFSIGVCEGFKLESLLEFIRSRSNDTPEGIVPLEEVAIMYCMNVLQQHESLLQETNVKSWVLEAMETSDMYPYARVVETHQELLAVIYDGEDEELPPFPDDDWEGWEGGPEDGETENTELDLI